MEMTSPTSQSGTAMIQAYAGISWRRKWLILGCIALSMALAWGYCLIAPKSYRSEALIVAEGQRLLDDFVPGSREASIEQRVFVSQRKILNQDFLGEIAREFSLYPKEIEEGGESSAILALASAVKVDRIKTELTGASEIDGFSLSFIHQDPRTAAKVTERIAEKFIEENTQERASDAEGALKFYDDELARLKEELEKKEQQITAYKRVHLGELPQHMDASFRSLDKLESEINSVSEGIQRHSDRLAMVEKATQEYRVYGRQNQAFITSPNRQDTLFARLKELREKQIKLKAEFRDEYPEVILTRQELRQVEEQLVELYGPEAIKPDKTQRDPYLQDLMKQESEEKSELNLLKQRLEMLKANRRSHEKHVERSNEVEQDLLVLERDYGSMKANYATLLDKRLHARVTENMTKKKGGKFRILEAASFPRTPVTPNMPRILVLGLLFGCVVGVGLAVTRERLTPQFREPEDVELLLGSRLLVAIPDFSFLWNQKKSLPYSPSSYRQRGSNGSAVVPQLEGAGTKRPQEHPQNGFGYERRFVTRFFPHTIASEQYRVAAARVQLLNTDAGSKIVVVTSAIKGEGKTTTVVNLGYTLARDFGKRVLLLDCDFIFPELQYFTETPARYGLVDCFRDNVPVEEAMISFADIPCWILPAGNVGHGSTELLKTGPFEHVLSQVRDKFDYILINAPPILPVATMNVLERHTDLILLVVRANLTSPQVVKRALDSLRVSNPIHVILNGVPMHSLPYYMIDYSGALPQYHGRLS